MPVRHFWTAPIDTPTLRGNLAVDQALLGQLAMPCPPLLGGA